MSFMKAEGVLPERECPGCGVTFQQHHVAQRYHDVPCRVDATDRNQRAKALERPRWKASDLECKGCKVVFLPQNAVQRYHDVLCRVDATDRNQRARALKKRRATRRWGYPMRDCEGCPVRFQPLYVVQTYHDVPCRKAATARHREATNQWKKDEIRRAAETLEKKRIESLEESARSIARLEEDRVYFQTNLKSEPLMALAEKEALAEGYEFEAIPDDHPRWADLADVRRSSAMNRIGVRRMLENNDEGRG